MNHLVYLETKSNELTLLLQEKMHSLLRGNMSSKPPYQQVHPGDLLFLVENGGNATIKALAKAKKIDYFGPLDKEESFQLIDNVQYELQLTAAQKKRIAGKKFVTILELEKPDLLPLPIPLKNDYKQSNTGWLPFQDIGELVEKQTAVKT